MKEYNKRHYALHQAEFKEKAKVRVKAKYQSDPEHRAKKIEYQKQLNAKRGLYLREYHKNYREENRDVLRAQGAERKRVRYATDPLYREQCKQEAREASRSPAGRAYAKARRAAKMAIPLNRLIDNIQGKVRSTLNGKHPKSEKTTEYIGCTQEEFRLHMESLWKEGMNWDNYGYRGWHADHIRPISSFSLDDPEQQRQCFHYTNFQPLWRFENQSKGDKWSNSDVLKESMPAFPPKMPTDRQADTSHIQLCRTDGLALWRHGEWGSRTECPDKKPVFIDRTFAGIAASNRFHFVSRMACDTAAAPSASRSWFIPEKHDKLTDNTFYENRPGLVLSASRYLSPQFRPSAAKAIYAAFDAKKVYDPCGGWGDRLEGALGTDHVTHYHCRDVNPLVFPAYASQKDRYDKTNKISMEMVRAEAGGLNGMDFDLVFTSPPYYKLERYQGEMQSHLEYKGFEEWINGFLFPMLACSWAALRDGGHMAINIADVYADHKVNRICGPMAEWAVKNLPNCNYLGSVGYRLAVRMNQPGNLGIIRAEPIMVFSKGPSDWMDRMLAKMAAIPA